MGYGDRILKYARGGPEAIDGWPATIPKAEFEAAIAATFGAALGAEGFQPVSARRFVRNRVASIRDVVDLQALKGATYCPVWGLSLDFAPHVDGRGTVKWHRTAKSAAFDLAYHPLDFAATAAAARDWSLSPDATPGELGEDLRRVTRKTLEQAVPFFDAIRDVKDLPAAYRRHRSSHHQGLPFEVFPQQILGMAFALARNGDSEAPTLLAEYVRSRDLPAEAAARLAALLAAAGR